MARLPRLSASGFPHHVIQRGNNGQSIFESDSDRKLLLTLLEEHATGLDVAIHAYVLMDNHFHLLATPRSSESISKMMQSIGRRYVRHFNLSQRRTGTLWEGRYRSTVIQADRHLLSCMVYMDLNPVRSGVVVQPMEYPWSSHAHYLGRLNVRFLKPHPLYWALGNTPFAREAAYAELVREGLTVDQLKALTDSALLGWALGDSKFLVELQSLTGRRPSKTKAGRPALSSNLANAGFNLSPNNLHPESVKNK